MKHALGLVLSLALASGLAAAPMSSAPSTKGSSASQGSSRKVAMLIMDPPSIPWSASRLLTALVFAGQLKRSGAKVEIIFYSFGVRWLSILEGLESAQETENDRRKASRNTAGFYKEYIGKEVLLSRYKALRDSGVGVAICPGSAVQMGINDELASRNVPLLKVHSDEKGEMNIAPLVDEGYQVWVF